MKNIRGKTNGLIHIYSYGGINTISIELKNKYIMIHKDMSIHTRMREFSNRVRKKAEKRKIEIKKIGIK